MPSLCAASTHRKWNTTLKSIIPLPDKLDERSYPEHPFPAGTSVLALYPETTSFYPAVIDSGPFAIASGTGKVGFPDYGSWSGVID